MFLKAFTFIFISLKEYSSDYYVSIIEGVGGLDLGRGPDIL